MKMLSYILEEIFPFVFFHFRKRRLMLEIDDDNFASEMSRYENYYSLSNDDLKERISQEHDRLKSIDDKSYKMTLAISLGLTLLAFTGSILIKYVPYTKFIVAIVTTSGISIFYSISAGLTAIGSLRTLPTYGYGTDFLIKSKNDQSISVKALASQEKLNIIRHIRNETAYQSLRNSIILLMLTLFIFALSLISYYTDLMADTTIIC